MKIAIEADSIEELRQIVLNMGLFASDKDWVRIEDLGLSARTISGLAGGNIFTVKKLLEHTPNDLLHLPYIGRIAIAEIERCLATRGYKLRTQSAPGG